jgi:hypothetical protein
MESIKRFNEKLENGFTKDIFDHVRNLLLGTFLLAIGTGQLQGPTNMFFSIAEGRFAGVGVIAVSCILIAINTYDGIRIINISRLHILISIPLIILYLFVTIKILEMAWNFRMIQ